MKLRITTERTITVEVDFQQLTSDPEIRKDWRGFIEYDAAAGDEPAPDEDDRYDFIHDLIFDLGVEDFLALDGVSADRNSFADDNLDIYEVKE